MTDGVGVPDMQQLPLEVSLADYALFETYFAGPNDACVHALRDAARVAAQAFVWVWGGEQSGRSHLLQACINAAEANGARPAYLPLGADVGLIPDSIDGLEICDVICVDDAHTVAEDAAWERALLLLYEGVRQRGGRLVISADKAPLHSAFRLPDLVSRFASAATFRLRDLSDDDRVHAMQLRARWRGLELPDDVARYILTRAERGMASLFDLLDRLDREALVAQRGLTVPFVREVLAKVPVGGS
ncbi:MAG: DnaA regulatory inactivator Hda [Gammaproteobacteria bacterium]|nr:DnaA regulatory inactivator Hda [Gammaproteobacteria bacterium]